MVYGAASAGAIIEDFGAGAYYGTKGAIVGLELNGEPFEFERRELTTHAPAWDWDAQMRVLPHVVGPHREIPESHVFEDVMQLVELVREGVPTAVEPRARAPRDRHHRERLPGGRERADADPADDLRAIVTTALGIDIGLSGARAAVLDERGALLGAGWARDAGPADRRTAPRPIRATGWRAPSRPARRRWRRQASRSTRSPSRPSDPRRCSSRETGEALGPALLFGLDRRAEAQRARLGVTHDHALPKLLWWAEHEPERLAGAATALDATGYVVAGLCGALAMDTITAEAYTLAGAESPLTLPAPCDPLALAGGLLPGAAETLGLPAGTPVIAGTLDSYADVAGTGTPPGGGCLLLGSTLIAYAVWPEPVAVPGLEVQHHPAPGVLIGGASVCGGATISWLEDLLGEGAGDLHALEPGAGGLLVLPYFAGERTPVNDPRASGALLGLTYSTTPEELRRAFVDAVALSALDHAERLRVHGIDPASWRAAGGATRNEALLHACSDALGRPLEVMPHAGAAIGPASLALRAAGVDWLPRPESRVEPDAARTARYAGLLGRYRAAYTALAPTMHALAEVS